MAKKAISDLDPAAPLDGTELIEGEQSGGSVQMTAANVARSIYKRYVALLSQTGTDAPTATVLENTLGGTVVWTRNDVGDYTGTLAGVFTENKTWCIAGTGFYNDNATNANVTRASSDTISLLVSSANGAIIDDWSDAAIEIRVYP